VVCGLKVRGHVPVCRACVAVTSPERLAYLVSARARPAVRTCLRCGQEFLSSHAGNRICGRCRGVETIWWSGWGGLTDDEG